MVEQAPYGAWRSPITADLIVKDSVFIGTHGFPSEVRVDGADVYWLEGRPNENGRGVVVRFGAEDTRPVDVTPSFTAADQRYFDVRTQVYEYGGGAWLVDQGTVYFSNALDGRLYRQPPGQQPQALTPPPPTKNNQDNPIYYYADGLIDRNRQHWIGVVEDWSKVDRSSEVEHERQPELRIAAIDLSAPGSDQGATVVTGHDFFSSPRLSPDGQRLAWLAWDHPRMPWQGTLLYVDQLDEHGKPRGDPVLVAGGPEEAILQPEWSLDGRKLWFISDRSGWWNLYAYQFNDNQVRSVAPMEAEFGQPPWHLAQSTYALTADERIVAACTKDGLDKLVIVDPATGVVSDMGLTFTWIESVQADRSSVVVFVAGSSANPMSVVAADLASGRQRILKRETDLVDHGAFKKYFSIAEQKKFPTAKGEVAYALYYPPANPDFSAPGDERPPLVVMCHGGPTSRASSVLSLEVQYRTSRGIAVLDVNFRGSSGFGRAYRDRLRENWGIIDVEDCVNGAGYLADVEGSVDSKRVVIMGRSGGGFTTLAALTSSGFHDFFRAGASHYGIGDLELLAIQTHKFESHYLDWLVGPTAEQLRERSPKSHLENLSRPAIFFQGKDDPVVPANQSQTMFEAIESKGLLAGYFLFDEERHGFRVAENLRRAIEAEHFFFSFEVFRSRLGFLGPKETAAVKGEVA
jgi:dipeptidyl aminopeptidase/acylaminoacyl peptidase